MIAALLIYSLSVLAFAGDFAFGRPRRAQATAVVRQAKERAAAMATVGSASLGSASVGSASVGSASVGGASVGGSAGGTGAGLPEAPNGRDSMPALALPPLR